MLIDKDKSSLLIIDVQEKLFSVMPKPHTFINNIVKLQKAAKILKIKNYCSEQYPNGLGKTIDKINENFFELTKKFEKVEFSVQLSKISDLTSQYIVCGIEAHVCVLQTAMNLAKNNNVYVVQDAISSRYEKDYLTALSRLDKHPNIHIVSCEMVLFEWLRTSDHSKFKTISQLIK